MSASVCKNRCCIRQTDTAEQRRALRIFAAAACLPVGVYLSEAFHLLEKPLFSKVYYGNLATSFFALCASIYIFGFFYLFFRFAVKDRLGITPFSRGAASPPLPLPLPKKVLLYLMTAAPVLIADICLGFRFKFIVALGERCTGMAALGNAVHYLFLDAAAKMLAVTGFIFLVERGLDFLCVKRPPLPYGGIAAALTFGVCEFAFGGSVFSPFFFALYLYEGVIYLVSGRRFGISYALGVLLCVL